MVPDGALSASEPALISAGALVPRAEIRGTLRDSAERIAAEIRCLPGWKERVHTVKSAASPDHKTAYNLQNRIGLTL